MEAWLAKILISALWDGVPGLTWLHRLCLQLGERLLVSLTGGLLRPGLGGSAGNERRW